MTLETFCISHVDFITGEIIGERTMDDYSFYIIRREDGRVTMIEKSVIYWRREH